jgi:hypothetical protein
MNEIVCPNCQSRQPAGSVFCDNCGHHLAPPPTERRGQADAPPGPIPPLTPAFLQSDAQSDDPSMIICPNCGAANLAGAKFCDQCGTALGERTEPRAPKAEPRAAEQTMPETTPSKLAGESSTMHEAQPAAPPPNRYVTGRLSLEPTGARLEFPPGRTEIQVGREDPVSDVFPEIDLTPFGGEAAGVSRRHARFTLQDGEIVIEDLDSTNFTFVNRKRVMPGSRQVVRNGDELRFGRITARYEGP